VRTIVLDLEISPHLTYTYDTFETNVVKMVRPQFLLSFQYRELGSMNVNVVALPDFVDHYKRKPYSDEMVVKALWKVIDEADVIIGHNVRAFDLKKSNARFAYWGLPAPSQYQIIDTLTLARGKFGFPGNSLAKLAEFLNVEQGKLHFGIEEWVACIEGDPDAWKRERKYGARDIQVTEEIYLKLRSYMTNHPNMNTLTGEIACHACTSKNLKPKGYRLLVGGTKKKRFLCRDCGTLTCERKGENLTLLSA
jgi:DNA polymerase elongation subunit (family B)